jgi:DUF4097 and DUF4098 domain-containing protein YvlB
VAEALKITTGSGPVRVVAEQRADVEVKRGRLVEGHAGRTVRGGSQMVELRVPLGTDLVVGTASGDVELRGHLGTVSVTTASGDLRAEAVASIDARTASGRLEVQESSGTVRLKTGSSPVHVHAADGELRVASISGQVRIERASGVVSVRTVSGNVDLGVGAAGGATVETVSGTVRILVPAGVHPATRLRSISGARHVECETGEDLEIAARSVSGDLSVAAER